MTRLPVAIEKGDKKVFASALEWPGWSRSGSLSLAFDARLVDADEAGRLAWHALDHALEMEDRSEPEAG